MISHWVLLLTGIAGISGNSISSPQIRILDVAETSSETRVFPHRFEANRYPTNIEKHDGGLRPRPVEQSFKSYVIYDDYPYRIFKEWRGNIDPEKYQDRRETENYFQDSRTQNGYLREQNGHKVFTRGNPTLAYQSIYSNVIRVVENGARNEGQTLGFSQDRIPQGYSQDQISPTLQPPFQTFYPRLPFQDERGPINLPQIFIPNERFHLSKFPGGTPKPPSPANSDDFYDQGMSARPTYDGSKDDAESIIEMAMKPRKRVALCSFIRLNNKKFPLDGGPCGRSEDSTPLLLPEYSDHSGLADDKLPMEHRRQHGQNKRLKRSPGSQGDGRRRQKRESSYGFQNWESPMGYGGGYSSYFSDFYSGQGGRNGYGNNNQNRNNRHQGYRNRNNNDYFDSYQSSDSSNSRGLTSFLTNGGRRYKNRNNDNDNDDNDDYRNNDNDGGDDDYNDNNNNSNNNSNNDYDSDENGGNQNDKRRGSNGRRNNNESSRNRRRNNNNNNNNNNDNDYDDNNNNRNNRYNNRNNQYGNNNFKRNNRNRNGYRNNNNYNNNGYGSSNGYSNYGNSNSGYGNSYGNSNGGYGSSYGSNYNRGYGSSGYGSSGYGSSSNRYGGSNYGSYGNNGYGNSGYGNSGSYGGSYGNNGNYGYGSGGYGSGGGFGIFGQGDF